MRDRLPRTTDRLELGDGLRVSPYCVGVVKDSDTIVAAFDAGVNFFFISADMHWPDYEATRVGLKKILAAGAARDRFVVAAVSYPTQPEFCTAPFMEVIEYCPWLERLDVCVMGGVYSHDFFPRWEVYRHNRERKLAGSRLMGATFHERQVAVSALNHGLLDIAFIRYNPSHDGAERDVFPRLATPRRAPLFGFNSSGGWPATPARYEALGVDSAHWRPTLTDYYRFAFSAPLDGLLIAPRTPGHVAELVRAIDQGPLRADEVDYMRDIADLVEGRAQVEGSGG